MQLIDFLIILGEQVSIQINEPINPDRVHVIAGKGLPNSKTGLHGDLLVKYVKCIRTLLILDLVFIRVIYIWLQCTF